MTDKEKIRAEIERRIEELQPCNTRENLRAHGAIAGYYQILSFINSMQEEPVSEDLEEAASRYANEEYNRKSPATLPDRCRGCYAPLIYAFKAGAKWQEKQDIKHGYITFLQGEKRFANYILEMINNGWHIVAIKTACNDKIKEK